MESLCHFPKVLQLVGVGFESIKFPSRPWHCFASHEMSNVCQALCDVFVSMKKPLTFKLSSGERIALSGQGGATSPNAPFSMDLVLLAAAPTVHLSGLREAGWAVPPWTPSQSQIKDQVEHFPGANPREPDHPWDRKMEGIVFGEKFSRVECLERIPLWLGNQTLSQK